MGKRDICIMRFDTATNIYHVFGRNIFDLDVIPRIGEKIVFDVEDEAVIAEVIDVHYSKDGGADVFIGKEQSYVDYKASLDAGH